MQIYFPRVATNVSLALIYVQRVRSVLFSEERIGSRSSLMHVSNEVANSTRLLSRSFFALSQRYDVCASKCVDTICPISWVRNMDGWTHTEYY
jgi:DNA polymerase II small subunit/DNA polymerase delta subunit B